MSAQHAYERGNAHLRAALESLKIDDSNNKAILACALYLKSITEMLGTKFKAEKK